MIISHKRLGLASKGSIVAILLLLELLGSHFGQRYLIHILKAYLRNTLLTLYSELLLLKAWRFVVSTLYLSLISQVIESLKLGSTSHQLFSLLWQLSQRLLLLSSAFGTS